jgi:hypothetical protein
LIFAIRDAERAPSGAFFHARDCCGAAMTAEGCFAARAMMQVQQKNVWRIAAKENAVLPMA